MIIRTFVSTSAVCMMLATAVFAQENEEVTEEETAAADKAADTMFIEVYGPTVPAYMTVSEAIVRMEEMGYTGIHDLDVEWGVYEVEAYAPDGNEVEIEFDPMTGAILDVDDNWF